MPLQKSPSLALMSMLMTFGLTTMSVHAQDENDRNQRDGTYSGAPSEGHDTRGRAGHQQSAPDEDQQSGPVQRDGVRDEDFDKDVRGRERPGDAGRASDEQRRNDNGRDSNDHRQEGRRASDRDRDDREDIGVFFYDRKGHGSWV
jgi:hypothetical protein